MGAVTEPALPQIRSELRETVGDAVLVHLKILFHLKGRKARRVCQIAAGAGIKLHLACGMFSSSQLFADLSGGKLEFRAMALSSVDFPTPELPVIMLIFPSSSFATLSMVSGLS